MDSNEIYAEACRVMERMSESSATVDEGLLILAVVTAHLLHHHAPDATAAGAAIARLNMHTADCYGRLQRGTLH